jgi:chromosome condensin MukBEF complex kleisin-like MukF subunit
MYNENAKDTFENTIFATMFKRKYLVNQINTFYKCLSDTHELRNYRVSLKTLKDATLLSLVAKDIEREMQNYAECTGDDFDWKLDTWSWLNGIRQEILDRITKLTQNA